MFLNFRKIKPGLDSNKRLGKTLEDLISASVLAPIFTLLKIPHSRYGDTLL